MSTRKPKIVEIVADLTEDGKRVLLHGHDARKHLFEQTFELEVPIRRFFFDADEWCAKADPALREFVCNDTMPKPKKPRLVEIVAELSVDGQIVWLHGYDARDREYIQTLGPSQPISRKAFDEDEWIARADPAGWYGPM